MHILPLAALDKVLQEVIDQGTSYGVVGRVPVYFGNGRDFEGNGQGKVLASGQKPHIQINNRTFPNICVRMKIS
jgi:hypothetical protein